MQEQVSELGNTTLTVASMFLERNFGLPFCAQCLEHEAGVPHAELREVMRRLVPPRFEREWRLCARCVREAHVVYAASRR